MVLLVVVRMRVIRIYCREPLERGGRVWIGRARERDTTHVLEGGYSFLI